MKVIRIAIALLFVAGCKTRAGDSALQEFGKAPVSTPSPLALKLHQLDNPNVVPPIKYQAFERRLLFLGFRTRTKLVDVEILNPSQEQFNYLVKLYSGGSSQVEYIENKIYKLEHFLPPIAQAVINHRFQEENDRDDPRFLAANCWGTTYEVLRNFRIPQPLLKVFYVDPGFISPLLRDPSRSCRVDLGPEHPGDCEEKGLKVGDAALYLNDKNELDHAAIYLDQDFYFEKAGVSSASPYRLVYRKSDSAYGEYTLANKTIEYRRFNKTPLDDPTSAINAAYAKAGNGKQLEFSEILLRKDQDTGVYSIPPEANQKIYGSAFTPPPANERGVTGAAECCLCSVQTYYYGLIPNVLDNAVGTPYYGIFDPTISRCTVGSLGRKWSSGPSRYNWLLQCTAVKVLASTCGNTPSPEEGDLLTAPGGGLSREGITIDLIMDQNSGEYRKVSKVLNSRRMKLPPPFPSLE